MNLVVLLLNKQFYMALVKPRSKKFSKLKLALKMNVTVSVLKLSITGKSNATKKKTTKLKKHSPFSTRVSAKEKNALSVFPVNTSLMMLDLAQPVN